MKNFVIHNNSTFFGKTIVNEIKLWPLREKKTL